VHLQLLDILVIWVAATALLKLLQRETKRYIPIFRFQIESMFNASVVIENTLQEATTKRVFLLLPPLPYPLLRHDVGFETKPVAGGSYMQIRS
jgi:hypothetical protein